MMELTILGGPGEHGRSSYLLRRDDQYILLDCGMDIQPEYDGERARLGPIMSGLQAVFLSHAHEDHSSGLQILQHYGYQGEIWTTRATVRQLPVCLKKMEYEHYALTEAGSVHAQAEVTSRDELQFRYLEDMAPPGEWISIRPELEICWGRAGHLPGSIWITLNWYGKKIFYTGDYSAESRLLQADRPLHHSRIVSRAHPLPGQIPDLDLAIVDAAYGVDTDRQGNKLAQLGRYMKETLLHSGTVLLPVPVYGRGQELMLWAYEQFPKVPILVEQELLDALKLFASDEQWLQPDGVGRIERLLQSTRLHSMTDDSSREALIQAHSSALIFTDDGMMQSSKAQQHYMRVAARQDNRVIFTGDLAQGSFGRTLMMDMEHRGCQILHVRYKVHQGLPDVRQMLLDLKSPRTLLVHAPVPRTDGLALRLEQEGFQQVHSLLAEEQLVFG
ncbi:MBL fold metallo-hydrolase [Paenibacillus hunanensis]|uniref:MBL fold metallo-hydrolase n=1 Tax=Paenibacillus hunanensis TaxID=539262 RepID=UPI002025CF3F|nr:MBL fold metallo-hydrolase [Paenibacillus hunanensis]MCL9659145.1 MBL fold metallo-hydrolase [Paenibacillus hunanensis]